MIPRGNQICPECAPKFKRIRGAYCLKCGKPLPKEKMDRCGDCRQKEHVFDMCRSAFVYDDVMRKCIYRFKYDNRKEYASYLGAEMAAELKEYLKACRADAIIPVPMYKTKEKKRGFNQAFLLAKEISRLTDIPIKNDLIIRKKNTKVMRSLSARERENNLKKAFKIVGDSVKLTNIILVDDIYTTGSTADAVAGELKAAGVRRVFVASLSTGNIDG